MNDVFKPFTTHCLSSHGPWRGHPMLQKLNQPFQNTNHWQKCPLFYMAPAKYLEQSTGFFKTVKATEEGLSN